MAASLEDLGRMIRQRREQLDLTIKQATAKAGVSDQTWGNLEAGRPTEPRSQRRAMRALGWSDDSAERILAGRKPTELETPSVVGAIEADPLLGADHKRLLVALYNEMVR